MTDEKLIARLRELANFERGVGVMQDFYCGDEMDAAADRIEALVKERDALREAADWQEKQRRDAFARRHINAPEDPHVAALCERYGYGAVMNAASRLWARKDSVGAFYVGGCIGIKPDAALTTEEGHE